MNFNPHYDLRGKHAFLSASQYHWLNYDEDRLTQAYFNAQAKEYGTRLHEFASECISLGQKLTHSKKTLNSYVNDAIKYRMKPEQILFYSYNCFGTCDAICFRNNVLRIHDLKTGSTPTHMEQLLIYAALFCLEYGVKPSNIEIILRIYQSDDISEYIPSSDEIDDVMSKIVSFDKLLNRIRLEED